MKAVLLGLLLLAALPQAKAADKEGRYTVVAGETCGTYMDERKDQKGVHYAQTRSWVAGYVTAYNRMAFDTAHILGDTDITSVLLWLENWCRANPLKSLAQGMQELTPELHPTRRRVGK